MRVEPPLCPYSSLRGNGRLGQVVEQRLGLFEVGGIEAFGKPAEDWGEQGSRLLRPALLSAQAGEAHRTAQFPGLCVLPACDGDALLDGCLGLAHGPGAGTVSEAEAAMQQSIDVARRQNAKSWELRGATSLARLWGRQGRCAEARDLLAPVYTWFTEGFDTADLKQSKALLDQLMGPAIAAEG